MKNAWQKKNAVVNTGVITYKFAYPVQKYAATMKMGIGLGFQQLRQKVVPAVLPIKMTITLTATEALDVVPQIDLALREVVVQTQN